MGTLSSFGQTLLRENLGQVPASVDVFPGRNLVLIWRRVKYTPRVRRQVRVDLEHTAHSRKLNSTFFEPKVMASFKYLLGFNCVLEVAGRHGVISSLPSTSVFMKVIEGSGSG